MNGEEESNESIDMELRSLSFADYAIFEVSNHFEESFVPSKSTLSRILLLLKQDLLIFTGPQLFASVGCVGAAVRKRYYRPYEESTEASTSHARD